MLLIPVPINLSTEDAADSGELVIFPAAVFHSSHLLSLFLCLLHFSKVFSPASCPVLLTYRFQLLFLIRQKSSLLKLGSQGR